MTGRRLLWVIPAFLYGLFVIWYTDFGGPLTPTEIKAFTTTMETNNYGADNIAKFSAFMESDTGNQFLMVNVIDLAENPPDVEGAAPGEDALQLMGRYMERMYAQLLKRACHPVFMGRAVHTSLDVVGIDGVDEWDMGALFRYRSRRTFMEVVTAPGIASNHRFKVAALSKTFAFPVEPELYLSDLRLLLGLIMLAGVGLVEPLIGRRRG